MDYPWLWMIVTGAVWNFRLLRSLTCLEYCRVSFEWPILCWMGCSSSTLSVCLPIYSPKTPVKRQMRNTLFTEKRTKVLFGVSLALFPWEFRSVDLRQVSRTSSNSHSSLLETIPCSTILSFTFCCYIQWGEMGGNLSTITPSSTTAAVDSYVAELGDVQYEKR